MREAYIICKANIIPTGISSVTQGTDIIEKTSFVRTKEVFHGELSGIRTPDTLLKRQVLCLLS